MNENALARAIALVGSQSELARIIGVRPQAVQKWARRGIAPAERVAQIAEATDWRVSCHELRPDVFPDNNFIGVERREAERRVRKRRKSDDA
jgi:DNA-binding transcriptional regulator YdaS (Cro superfamily)